MASVSESESESVSVLNNARAGKTWLVMIACCMLAVCVILYIYFFLRLATSIYIYTESERDIYQLASLLAVFATWDNEENVNPLRSTVKFDISQQYLST